MKNKFLILKFIYLFKLRFIYNYHHYILTRDLILMDPDIAIKVILVLAISGLLACSVLVQAKEAGSQDYANSVGSMNLGEETLTDRDIWIQEHHKLPRRRQLNVQDLASTESNDVMISPEILTIALSSIILLIMLIGLLNCMGLKRCQCMFRPKNT